jgi:hypothetical protein
MPHPVIVALHYRTLTHTHTQDESDIVAMMNDVPLSTSAVRFMVEHFQTIFAPAASAADTNAHAVES